LDKKVAGGAYRCYRYTTNAIELMSGQGKELRAYSASSILGFRLIFAKHDGDHMNQPDWAEDGSFLVIRELQQLVPEFEK
jgi:hypothetical protein